MTGDRFTVASWALIAIAVILSIAASSQRARAVTAEDRDEVIRYRRLAVWAAGLACICAAIGLVEPLPAGGGRPAPTPTPSCAYLVDFPDSDPPIYDVCVPPEEAG